MLIDVSHMTDKGFSDVIELSTSPIIASHSNSRKKSNHRRNLTDEQILQLKKNGGVMGINLYPDFLRQSGSASIKDIIKHIEHVSALAGSEILGIGADFDGIDDTPEDIKGVQDLYKIIDELSRLNYSDEYIRKLAGGNFMRVIKEEIGRASCRERV